MAPLVFELFHVWFTSIDFTVSCSSLINRRSFLVALKSLAYIDLN